MPEPENENRCLVGNKGMLNSPGGRQFSDTATGERHKGVLYTEELCMRGKAEVNGTISPTTECAEQSLTDSTRGTRILSQFHEDAITQVKRKYNVALIFSSFHFFRFLQLLQRESKLYAHNF